VTQTATRYTFVLVHGAWQGSWAWDTIVPRLKAAGHDAIAADLPGDGFDSTPPQEVTLDLYAAHVSRLVDAVKGPVVLVGHSMGGTVVEQTCELRPQRVALAIYLCAFLLPDGMSVIEFYARYLRPEMRGAHARVTYDPHGLTSSIDPASAVEVFYHQTHLPLQRKMQELTPCLATYALESDHAPQLSHPDALTELLLKAAARNARAA
jgi:pimeloyl-ACP methyl ester carboxylesterase